jgi:hypothetical protein
VKYSGDTLNCLNISTGNTLTDALGSINLGVCSLQLISGLVKSDPADTVPATLQEKLKAGANIVLTQVGSGSSRQIQIDAIEGGGSVVDEQVKVSATDTTTGYLFDKLTTSDCITWVRTNSGLNEKLQAVIDWDCALLKLSSSAGWCTVVQNCQTMTQPCGQISGLSKQNSSSSTLTLSWLGAVNAISYEVKLFSDSGFTSQIGATQTASVTNATFTGLVPNTSYYATVKTSCSVNSSTPFGAGPFTTDQIAQSSCPSITLNSPIVSNDSVTVSWSGGSGATGYNVYIDNIADSGNPTSSLAFTKTGLTNGNHTVKVEALPCSGTPKSDNRTFNVNYQPPCIAPATPSGVSGPVSNTCPNESINLNSLITNYPSGSSIEWHTFNNTDISSLVGSPSVVTLSRTYYAFSKSDSTSCYSNNSYSVVVNIVSCAAAFSVTPNCNAMTIQSGTFVAGSVSTGIIRIPVNVVGNGTLYYSITGGGFTSSVIAYSLSGSNLFIDVPVSYDGSGSVGNHTINLISQTNPTATPITACTGSVPVICPTCVLNSGDVSISGIGSTTTTVNIAGLNPGDTYDISIYDNSGLIQAATAQSSSTFIISGLSSTSTYSVQVIKKCACGNVSSIVTQNFSTLDILSGVVVLEYGVGGCSQQGQLGLTFNLTTPLVAPLTLQVAGVEIAPSGSFYGTNVGYGCSLISSVFTTGCSHTGPAVITIPAGVSTYSTGTLQFTPITGIDFMQVYPNCNNLHNTIYPLDLYLHPLTNVTINLTCNPNGTSNGSVGIHQI